MQKNVQKKMYREDVKDGIKKRAQRLQRDKNESDERDDENTRVAIGKICKSAFFSRLSAYTLTRTFFSLLLCIRPLHQCYLKTPPKDDNAKEM